MDIGPSSLFRDHLPIANGWVRKQASTAPSERTPRDRSSIDEWCCTVSRWNSCNHFPCSKHRAAGDGLPNYRDPDSDNDGIDDSVEGSDDLDGAQMFTEPFKIIWRPSIS